MKKYIWLILLSLPITAATQTRSMLKSPPLAPASPESVGMSQDRLDRIDAMCKQAITEDQVPGIVALVARKGKIVFHQAYGTSNADGSQLDKNSIFRIASQTKAITSTAVMMLWEQGLFQLDDPISKYIPEFAETGVLQSFRYRDTSFTTRPVNSQITIRHLLTHTSGLGYGEIDGDERFKMMYAKAGMTDLFSTKAVTIADVVKRLAKLPLHHDPGEKFTYSLGLDVLGYFIEIMSGKSFSDFLQEHLFKPLGMNDTHFYLPDNISDRLVSVQHSKDGRWENYPVTFYDTDYPKKGARTFYSGGAGLSSTAKDYATFLQMYLNNGELNGTRYLSRTTIDFMMDNQIGDHGSRNPYGLAFGVLNADGEARGGQGSEGTFTWGGYFNTQYFADPEDQFIGVLMKQTQGTNMDQTGWKFRLLVGQAIDD